VLTQCHTLDGIGSKGSSGHGPPQAELCAVEWRPVDRERFWAEGDDEAVLAEYLAEHSYYGAFDPATSTFAVMFGDESRLPSLPEVSTCVFCTTPVQRHGEAGWRHALGFHARGGCDMPCPRPG
jgi:hypothetical protein